MQQLIKISKVTLCGLLVIFLTACTANNSSNNNGNTGQKSRILIELSEAELIQNAGGLEKLMVFEACENCLDSIALSKPHFRAWEDGNKDYWVYDLSFTLTNNAKTPRYIDNSVTYLSTKNFDKVYHSANTYPSKPLLQPGESTFVYFSNKVDNSNPLKENLKTLSFEYHPEIIEMKDEKPVFFEPKDVKVTAHDAGLEVSGNFYYKDTQPKGPYQNFDKGLSHYHISVTFKDKQGKELFVVSKSEISTGGGLAASNSTVKFKFNVSDLPIGNKFEDLSKPEVVIVSTI